MLVQTLRSTQEKKKSDYRIILFYFKVRMDVVTLTHGLRRCTALVWSTATMIAVVRQDARLWFGVFWWVCLPGVLFCFVSSFSNCSQTPGFFSSRFGAGLIPPTGTLFPNSLSGILFLEA